MVSLEEYKQRRLQGMSPEEASKEEGFSLSKTIGNIPSSAGNFIGGIGNAIIHPVQTVKSLGSVAAGGLEKLIPGRQAEEASFDSLTDHYKQRYGSLNSFLSTLESDPIGVAADVSTVLSGGGAMLSKLSKTGKIADAASAISRTGEALNPLTQVGKSSSALQSLLPKVAKAIEKNNWRLTKTKEGGLLTTATNETLDAASIITKNKLNELAGFLAKQKIVGNPLERYAKATQLYNNTEQVLDDFFGSMAKDSGIKKDTVVRGLQSLKGVYRGTRDSEAVAKQIDGAIKVIKKDFPENVIPYQKLNRFKRTTYQNAYNKAGDKVVDGIEHSIGDVIRGQMDESLRGLKVAGQPFEDFNHNYGLLIESRKLLKSAVGKSQLSALSEKLLGGTIGYALGGATLGFAPAVGGGLGAAFGSQLFEKLPITKIRSAVGAGAQSLGSRKLPQGVRNLKTPITATQRIMSSQQ